MKFIGKLFITILLTFSLSVEAGDAMLPHASAQNEIRKNNWRAAFLQLPPLRAVAPPEGDATCGIERRYAFSQTATSVISSAVKDIPCELVNGLKTVNMFTDANKPRALASATSLHLRNDFFDLPEAKRVLIHELGHIVDLSGLKSKEYAEKSAFMDGNVPVFADDASVLFYSLSWKDSQTKHKNARKQDFVTGYATSDPFEDFAESMLFYMEHGNTFRAYAEANPILTAKYAFFKTHVFDGKEFVTGVVPADASVREWDATKM